MKLLQSASRQSKLEDKRKKAKKKAMCKGPEINGGSRRQRRTQEQQQLVVAAVRKFFVSDTTTSSSSSWTPLPSYSNGHSQESYKARCLRIFLGYKTRWNRWSMALAACIYLVVVIQRQASSSSYDYASGGTTNYYNNMDATAAKSMGFGWMQSSLTNNNSTTTTSNQKNRVPMSQIHRVVSTHARVVRKTGTAERPAAPAEPMTMAERIIRGSSITTREGNLKAQAVARETVQTQTKQPQQSSKNQKKDLKIAMYMTTHMSEQHLAFIVRCWPAAVQQLPLLQQADLIVYTSASWLMDPIFRNLGFHNVTIHRYMEAVNPNGALRAAVEGNNDLDTQKQDGAVRAMVEPFLPQNLWFSNYDWVIRVNPDVLIRRDTWLLETMHNESVAGILVPWQSEWHGFVFHSDFYAFRPRAVDATALIATYQQQKANGRLHAETQLFQGFARLYQNHYPNQQLVWLPGVETTQENGIAHVAGLYSDVQHVHQLVDHCPNYFDVSDGVVF